MAHRPTAGVDTPQMAAFQELMRAQHELARLLDKELQDESGLSFSEYWVLLSLRYAPEGSMPVGALCSTAHMTRSGITRLLDRLVEAGLVQRVSDSTDRRSVRALLTDHGRRELRNAWPIHRRGINDHFSVHLSDSEALTLRDLLRRVAPDTSG